MQVSPSRRSGVIPDSVQPSAVCITAEPAGELYSEAALPLIHIHMETVILIEVRV
jgi:hypothetical protein